MIEEFTKAWFENLPKMREKLGSKHPEGYIDIVRAVIEMLSDAGTSLDPGRINEIDYCQHQGTLLYLICERGYQPSKYWSVKVGYGSCSTCDTLQSIFCGDVAKVPTEMQVSQYMTLALHVVQGIREIGGDEV
jgi:hypothetical protein